MTRLKQEPLYRICDYCDSTFSPRRSEVAAGRGRYCSLSCYNSHKKVLTIASRATNTVCAFCHGSFYRKPSSLKGSKSGFFFCGRECQAAGFLDPAIPIQTGPKPSDNPSKLRCSSCPATIWKTNSTGMCRSCIRSGLIERWLNGDSEAATYKGTSREVCHWVKPYLQEVRGDRCEECGWDEKAPDGRSIIQMDHIDGDYTNNLYENLRLLCPNHHAMTPTYGSLNMGSGRRHRRKSVDMERAPGVEPG